MPMNNSLHVRTSGWSATPRGKRRTLKERVRKELFTGAARYLSYPVLSIFALATIASAVGLIRPELFEFMRTRSVFVEKEQAKETRQKRQYGNLSVEKFVKKAVDMRVKKMPPEKIESFLEEKSAVSASLKKELKAVGIPIDRALKYWGSGSSADQTMKRLKSEGVNLQRGYAILKRRGIPVRRLMERAQNENVGVSNMKKGSAQGIRGKKKLFGGLGR